MVTYRFSIDQLSQSIELSFNILTHALVKKTDQIRKHDSKTRTGRFMGSLGNLEEC